MYLNCSLKYLSSEEILAAEAYPLFGPQYLTSAANSSGLVGQGIDLI